MLNGKIPLKCISMAMFNSYLNLPGVPLAQDVPGVPCLSCQVEVLDVASGRGGDQLKFVKAGPSGHAGADSSCVTLTELRSLRSLRPCGNNMELRGSEDQPLFA